MYKLEISPHDFGFKFRIIKNSVVIGEGIRTCEFEAKIDGMEALNLARIFNLGSITPHHGTNAIRATS